MQPRKEISYPRSIGYRRVGGLYVAGDLDTVLECDRLPWSIQQCHVCGSGPRPSRQPRKLERPDLLFEGTHRDCLHGDERAHCPICFPTKRPMLLCWMPAHKVNPTDFNREARKIGSVCWRLRDVPKWFQLGKNVLLLAYGRGEQSIYAGFIPTRLETVIWRFQMDDIQIMNDLERAGIQPYWVDHTDPLYKAQFNMQIARKHVTYGG